MQMEGEENSIKFPAVIEMYFRSVKMIFFFFNLNDLKINVWIFFSKICRFLCN